MHQGQNGFKYKPVMIVIHGGAFLKSSTKTSNWAPTVSKYFAMPLGLIWHLFSAFTDSYM